ncbi:unnamed protein product [Effrenium voratum]|uniref:Uncharacterized protein n=1 Tax=Effrenium voratum TaxID=2562239 RepID=A0AA36N1H4_9DINO|nr:unnamed protein product [Effrenium voratum]CAJ1428344.1 unnamed protein product [Effrenium voratum]
MKHAWTPSEVEAHLQTTLQLVQAHEEPVTLFSVKPNSSSESWEWLQLLQQLKRFERVQVTEVPLSFLGAELAANTHAGRKAILVFAGSSDLEAAVKLARKSQAKIVESEVLSI